MRGTSGGVEYASQGMQVNAIFRAGVQYGSPFVGFPTWGMQLPPPIKSFLHQYDFSNKTVIPFNSNAGYGIGSSFQTVKKLCKNSKILEGFETKGGVERDGILFVMKGKKEEEITLEIKNWLKRIGFYISGQLKRKGRSH